MRSLAGFLRLNVPITDPRFGQLIPCECRLREQELRKHEELLNTCETYQQLYERQLLKPMPSASVA